ncbi:hypothetical protein CSAL01_06580 [Colletotrichum salicis]|uniref:Amino acid permease n=1 Tax=Colletotrichum salicis TaxID=1209931 RepID=A0A135V310_9PEZI|nr:hypothetical protein CSAL01_06580 [Colletotrichum salicis]
MYTSNRKTSVSSEKDPTKPAADTKPSLLPSKSHDQGSISNSTFGGPVDVDDIILRANGHNTAMRRQFSWMSALGLGFSITNSWVGYLSNFGQNLIYGGPQSCLFGLLAAFVAQFIITLGLSEIASAFPMLWDISVRRNPFRNDWLLASCFRRDAVADLPDLCWNGNCHKYVISSLTVNPIFLPVALTSDHRLQVLPVVFTSKKITLTVQISLYSSLIGFFIVLTVITVMHKHAMPMSFITQSGLGSSGWSPGVAWILGITNAMYAFGGTDGGTQLFYGSSERSAPLLILNKQFTSAKKYHSREGEFLSEDVTLFLFAYILLVYLVCIPSQWVTGGRLAWAFARDHGVPFSRYFSKIDEKRELPLRATIASYVFACLYGLLYLASTTAFNSIVTSAVLFLNITYVVPQGILLFQGRNKSLPPHYLNLGWFGYVCNVFSVLWIVILGVFICMPPTLPVTAGSMNYTCVVLVGLLGIVLVFWSIDGWKNFKGPNIDWDMIKALNSAGTATEGQRG